MKTFVKLKWNKFASPNEEWITDYLWNNYEYFNKVSEEVFNNLPKIKRFNGRKLVLLVFAFNNFETINLQYKLIRENLGDIPIIYIDDSTDEKVSTDIINLANSDKNCDYWKVPRRPVGEGIDIYYHNIAINLAYYYVAKRLNCKYIGFLDHDIFPLTKINLIDKIKDYDFYGKEGLMDVPNTGIRYPWPGLSFFNKSALSDRVFNYFQTWVLYKDNWLELDTGGAMYHEFISKGSHNKFVYSTKYEYENDYFEIIDSSWLHLRDLSNWSGKGLNRFPLILNCRQIGLSNFINQFKVLK